MNLDQDRILSFGKDFRGPAWLSGKVNPLPDTPILGSFSSAANKVYDGINMDKRGYNYLLE